MCFSFDSNNINGLCVDNPLLRCCVTAVKIVQNNAARARDGIEYFLMYLSRADGFGCSKKADYFFRVLNENLKKKPF